MARSVDHQLSCLVRRVVGYRRLSCRCWPSHSEQRSVPSHDADPDQCCSSHLVLRASTAQSKLRWSCDQNAFGTLAKPCCSCSPLAHLGWFISSGLTAFSPYFRTDCRNSEREGALVNWRKINYFTQPRPLMN